MSSLLTRLSFLSVFFAYRRSDHNDQITVLISNPGKPETNKPFYHEGHEDHEEVKEDGLEYCF